MSLLAGPRLLAHCFLKKEAPKKSISALICTCSRCFNCRVMMVVRRGIFKFKHEKSPSQQQTVKNYSPKSIVRQTRTRKRGSLRGIVSFTLIFSNCQSCSLGEFEFFLIDLKPDIKCGEFD